MEMANFTNAAVSIEALRVSQLWLGSNFSYFGGFTGKLLYPADHHFHPATTCHTLDVQGNPAVGNAGTRERAVHQPIAESSPLFDPTNLW